MAFKNSGYGCPAALRPGQFLFRTGAKDRCSAIDKHVLFEQQTESGQARTIPPLLSYFQK